MLRRCRSANVAIAFLADTVARVEYWAINL